MNNKNLQFFCYVTAVCLISFSQPSYAEWFNVTEIRTNLITPVYTLVNENLGFVAFAVGGGANARRSTDTD